MSNKLECPKCGATIEVSGPGLTAACAYCNSLVELPEDLRQAVIEVHSAKTIKNARVWVILFIVVVFVLPTCLGVAGTLIGVAAQIFAVLATGILSLFGN